MAIIPLKQTITVIPASDELTEFDTPATGEPYTQKCRYQETVALVKSMVNGKEAISKATIMFGGYELITEHTRLVYTPESGKSVTHAPLSVAVKRHINGKPLLTVVHV